MQNRFFQPLNESRERAAISRTRSDVQNTLGKLIADPMLHNRSFRDRRIDRVREMLEALNHAVSTRDLSLIETVYNAIKDRVAQQQKYGLLKTLPLGEFLEKRLEQAEEQLQVHYKQIKLSGPRGP